MRKFLYEAPFWGENQEVWRGHQQGRVYGTHGRHEWNYIAPTEFSADLSTKFHQNSPIPFSIKTEHWPTRQSPWACFVYFVQRNRQIHRIVTSRPLPRGVKSHK